MKIQCDVCSKDEASVFCTADEAALCDACDHRVHHANKLASKHQRFSLVHPSSKNFPLCDICQEKRAFLFCHQDRAILCRGCDGPIHKANEHTQKHNRFLLTGVKLSAASAVYTASSSATNSVNNSGPHSESQHHQSTKKPVLVCPLNFNPSSTSNTPITKGGHNLLINERIGAVSSTISEYLMETLPGWHVEDFLDFPSTPFGFIKPDEEILPLVGGELGSSINPLSTETTGIWVPQAPTPLYPSQHYPQMGPVLEETKEMTNMKTNNRRWADDVFTVPQMSPPSSGSKRVRPFW